MSKEIEIYLEPLYPVTVLTSERARDLFGHMYKYDLPKWCAENQMRCFYKPETLVYVIIPKALQEL